MSVFLNMNLTNEKVNFYFQKKGTPRILKKVQYTKGTCNEIIFVKGKNGSNNEKNGNLL